MHLSFYCILIQFRDIFLLVLELLTLKTTGVNIKYYPFDSELSTQDLIYIKNSEYINQSEIVEQLNIFCLFINKKLKQSENIQPFLNNFKIIINSYKRIDKLINNIENIIHNIQVINHEQSLVLTEQLNQIKNNWLCGNINHFDTMNNLETLKNKTIEKEKELMLIN